MPSVASAVVLSDVSSAGGTAAGAPLVALGYNYDPQNSISLCMLVHVRLLTYTAMRTISDKFIDILLHSLPAIFAGTSFESFLSVKMF